MKSKKNGDKQILMKHSEMDYLQPQTYGSDLKSQPPLLMHFKLYFLIFNIFFFKKKIFLVK